MKMHVYKTDLSLVASTGQVQFVMDAMAALLITFSAAFGLIQAGARYGIQLNDLDFLVLLGG
jgi:hypothetical protein